MKNLIQSPAHVSTKNDLMIFLAGPIKGSPKWQLKLAEDINSLNLNIVIANPRRDNDPNFNYDEQVNWETFYLNKADIIVCYIPKEEEKVDNHLYAQTTRFELGEWLANSSKLKNKKVLVCIDNDEFPMKKYIKEKVQKQYKNCSEFFDSYDSLIKGISKEYERLHNEKKIFFTSDTHFGSERTFDLSRRPFRSVDEMDDAIINNWNDIVKPWDTVYHLGDFGNYSMSSYLNGTIHLIMGNYEVDDINKGKLSKQDLVRYFASVNYTTILESEDESKIPNLFLCHKPSNHREELFTLYAHIHGRQMIRKYGMDVGVDCNNFRPISLDDIVFFYTAIKNFYDDEVFN